ncbi:MAG: PQQ-like beta-propeller repeat protein [Planctomycetaceae bacterium]|nr:PQQ-like beta-propeller repeat protein [Planctomycetaceae bacterium]
MPRFPAVAATALCLWPLTFAAADDWPGWRGPQRNGISREAGLLKSWPAEGPKLAWKATGLGEGFSTPSVVGRSLYTMGNRDGQELVLAVDVNRSGKTLWAAPIGPVRHAGAGYPGPRSSPTYDDGKLYCLGLNGDLLCLDAANGSVLWRVDLVAEYGGKIPTWGYSESPLVDGPWVVCTPGGDKATLTALDKTTGRQAWGTAFGDRAGYSSIVAAEIDGEKQYVQFTATGVVGVAAADGRLRWRYDRPANGTANCSTPVVAGNRVFAASGYGTGGGAVDVKKTASEFAADEAYFTKEMKNHHGGLILVDGLLYGSDDPGILTCVEYATGKSLWRERAAGKCSLVYFDGHLIARSEKGPVSLVKVSAEKAEIVGSFEQPERSEKPSWPHPVVADGRLYLRDQDVLLCYELK